MSRAATVLRRIGRALAGPRAAVCWLVLAVVPWMYAGRYNHPSNDDYFNAVWQDYGGFQKWLYLHSTGRYFSSLVVSCTPLHWHSWAGYRLAAWLIIIATAAAVFSATLKLCTSITVMSSGYRYMLSAGTVAVMFNGMASPEQGLYWYTGAMTYTLAALLLIWFLMLCLSFHQIRQVRPPLSRRLLAGCLLMCVIGSNESTIPLSFLVCGALAAYYRRSGWPKLEKFYLWLLLLCFACAAAAMLAPGNNVRQGTIPRNLLVALPSWLLFTKDMVLGWMAEPFLLLYSFAVLIATRRIILRIHIPLWITFVAPFALTCIITLPGFWALGRMPPYRVQNIAYIFFLMLWNGFLLQLAGQLTPLWDNGRSFAKPLREMAGIAITAWILSGFTLEELRRSSNYYLLAKNLAQGSLRDFDNEVEARYMLLSQSGADTLLLKPLQYRHHNTLYFADISPDPAAFPNPEYAQFWGKKLLRLDTAAARLK